MGAEQTKNPQNEAEQKPGQGQQDEKPGQPGNDQPDPERKSRLPG